MKIFVSGGGGYIGSTTAAHLLEAGHEVIVFDNLFMEIDRPFVVYA